jgi:hypothetical protein
MGREGRREQAHWRTAAKTVSRQQHRQTDHKNKSTQTGCKKRDTGHRERTREVRGERPHDTMQNKQKPTVEQRRSKVKGKQNKTNKRAHAGRRKQTEGRNPHTRDAGAAMRKQKESHANMRARLHCEIQNEGTGKRTGPTMESGAYHTQDCGPTIVHRQPSIAALVY